MTRTTENKSNDKFSQEEFVFLQESNYIEAEFGKQAQDDSIEAWKYAKNNRHCMTSKYILNIHKLLMKNNNPRIAGKLRDCVVYIAGRVCPFISEEVLMDRVKTWIKDTAFNRVEKPDAEQIKDWHVYFESIHPFEDGNGRVGRILMNVQRLNANLPIEIIRNKDKYDYYKWFKKLDKV